MRRLFVRDDGRIIGVAERCSQTRVHIADAETAKLWWAKLRNRELPEDAGYAITEDGLNVLIGSFRPDWTGEAEIDEEQQLYNLGPLGMRFLACAQSFRSFLQVWRFLDQDTGVVRCLGDSIWPGQEHYAEVAEEHDWVYYLKARQLGETTIAIAYDGWVMRFRTPNARVHLVSRTETLAKTSLLKPLKFGLRNLPEEMQLPERTDSATIFEIDAGPDDRRIGQAYAAKEPGRGETCSHLHLDEWAAMAMTQPELPREVWTAAEPTVSKHGGTVHILTTGTGPTGFYADTWKKCVAGEGQLYACFIPAAGSRPEYTKEWLETKQKQMGDDEKYLREYPEKWQDALRGKEGTFFAERVIALANEYARGFQPAGHWKDFRGRVRPRKYIKAWDIGGPGENSDAVVATVLDVTETVWDVVEHFRHTGESYPTTAYRIEQLHASYPGLTVIEDNAAGAAVRAFLQLSEDECIGFSTTRQSKPVILSELQIALQYEQLKWKHEECPQLTLEMREYKIPDDGITQDCVMSLAIAVHHGAQAALTQGGRVLEVVRV